MISTKLNVKLNLKKLKKLQSGQLDEAIRRGLEKGAIEVERKGKIYSPYKSGDLRKSIRAERAWKVGNGWSVIISPHMPYAAAMEMPGRVLLRGRRPYMKPALLESKKQIKMF